MALPLLGALRFDLLSSFSKLTSWIYLRCILFSCQIPEENHRDVYLELPSTKEWRPSEGDDIERFEQNVTLFNTIIYYYYYYYYYYYCFMCIALSQLPLILWIIVECLYFNCLCSACQCNHFHYFVHVFWTHLSLSIPFWPLSSNSLCCDIFSFPDEAVGCWKLGINL